MNEAVSYTQAENIVTISMQNIATKNMISAGLIDGLVAACTKMNEDLSAKCAVLTAAGRIFSAGGNIQDMHARRGHFSGSPAESRRAYENGVQRLARAFYELEVPVICAINGPAMGAGLDLSLMCDIRIASDNVRIAESFIRLSLVSAAGGAWFLPRAVGASAAAEMTLTGDEIDARRALEIGLVSRVVAPDDLMTTALGIAARIARHPVHAIRLNKRLLRESASASLATALELAASMQGIVQHTEDHLEAVAAVVEHRDAVYSNR